jgi:hypothetical protein
LRLHRDIKGSRRLIGDQDIGRPSAIAIIRRWRWRLKLVRIIAHHLCVDNADACISSSVRARASLMRHHGRQYFQQSATHECKPDEVGERILEYHGDLLAIDRRRFSVSMPNELSPL